MVALVERFSAKSLADFAYFCAGTGIVSAIFAVVLPAFGFSSSSALVFWVLAAVAVPALGFTLGVMETQKDFQRYKEQFADVVDSEARHFMEKEGIILSTGKNGGPRMLFQSADDITYNGWRHMRNFERTVQQAAQKFRRFPNLTDAERSSIDNRLSSIAIGIRLLILRDDPQLGGAGRCNEFDKTLRSIR